MYFSSLGLQWMATNWSRRLSIDIWNQGEVINNQHTKRKKNKKKKINLKYLIKEKTNRKNKMVEVGKKRRMFSWFLFF